MLQRQTIITALKKLKAQKKWQDALDKLGVKIFDEDHCVWDSCIDLIALHINPKPSDELIDILGDWVYEEPKDGHRIKYDGEWVNVDDAGKFYDMMLKIFGPNQATQKESGDGC